MKLFIYEHCVFCVRARMIFALKRLPITINILQNDDEATPVSMIGVKMVPILQKDDGSFMPESLDIVRYIDQHYGPPILTGEQAPWVSTWIEKIMEDKRKLVSPRIPLADFPEFNTPHSRHSFIQRKESTPGQFAEYFAKTKSYLPSMEKHLQELATLLSSEHACHGELSLDDILLFPVLRDLSLVKSLRFPAKVEAYCRSMEQQTNIHLLDQLAI